MHIKKITVSNFKSFANTTTIDLSPGINVFIGSNGSGKSSILAAIEFLLLTNYKKLFFEDKKALLYEGTNIDMSNGYVEIEFDNTDGRFPLNKAFKLKRVINLKKDEFYLDDKNITKEEIEGILESGISRTNNYIIEQGKVFKWATISEKERMELIKEVSGCNIYERDRENSLKLLEETEITEQKIDKLFDKLRIKVSKINEEREKKKKLDELEKEKRIIERIIAENELKNINLDIDGIVEEREEKIELNEELREIRQRIEIKEEEKRMMKENFNEIKTQENLKTKEEEEKEFFKLKAEEFKIEKNLEESFKNSKIIKDEEKKLNIKIKALEFEEDFLKTFLIKKEIKEEEIENNIKILRERKKELKEIKNNNRIKMTEDEIKRNLNKKIEERKKLWREEIKIKEEITKTKNIRKLEEKRVLRNIEEFKIEGVHDYLFKLIEIPEELLNGVEILLGSNLFNLVVENEEVVKKILKITKEKITFIPLNRIKHTKYEIIEDENIIPIFSLIKTEDKYKNIIKYLTRNTYLVSDLRSGSILSKKYNINVITTSGDIIRRNGIISGGHKEFVLKEYKRIEKDLKTKEKKQKEICKRITEIENEINILKNIKIMENESYEENLEAIILFLENKLKKYYNIQNYEEKFNFENIKNTLTKNIKNMNLNNEKELNIKKLYSVRKEIEDLKNEIEYKSREYNKIKNKIEEKEEVLRTLDIIEEKNKIDKEIEILIEKLSILKERMEENLIEVKDIDKERKKEKRKILEEKRNLLINKIGEIGIEEEILEKYQNKNLMKELKSLKEEIGKIKVREDLTKDNLKDDELLERKRQLLETKNEIKKLIEELDNKKKNVFNYTLNTIKENFNIYHKKLTSTSANLVEKEDELEVSVDHPESLSGGQKTLIALSLILAIQKVDPSPFYFFDEIDANLDKESRISLGKVLKEHKIQMVIISFKEEMVNIGDKIFKVKHQDKKSMIETIEKDNVIEILS